jgi:hypothetical protein
MTIFLGMQKKFVLKKVPKMTKFLGIAKNVGGKKMAENDEIFVDNKKLRIEKIAKMAKKFRIAKNFQIAKMAQNDENFWDCPKF